MRERIRAYYQLTKPGIIYGNVMTTASGLALAILTISHRLDVVLSVSVLLGTALVIASACVFNNYHDRDIDIRMKRTSHRALVTGSIKPLHALLYASLLGLIGFGLLMWQVNLITAAVGLIGFIDYLWFYAWGKRHSVHGTLIGTIAGATPIVAGYTAVSGRIDGVALLLFTSMCAWQMPHFYAIAMYRLKDYKQAAIPVLPAVSGFAATKKQIMVYAAVFLVCSVALGVVAELGYLYLVIMVALGCSWLWRGWQGRQTAANAQWGKSMFLFSLTVLLGFSIALPAGAVLP